MFYFVRPYSCLLYGHFLYPLLARGALRLPGVPLPALRFDLRTRQPPYIEMEDLQMTLLNLRDV